MRSAQKPHQYNSVMPTHNLLASIGPFLLLASTALGSAQAPSGEIEIPFSQGFDVAINGSVPIHFGLDTGLAWDFFISSEQAHQLALPVIGQHTMHTSDRKEIDAEAHRPWHLCGDHSVSR